MTTYIQGQVIEAILEISQLKKEKAQNDSVKNSTWPLKELIPLLVILFNKRTSEKMQPNYSENHSIIPITKPDKDTIKRKGLSVNEHKIS